MDKKQRMNEADEWEPEMTCGQYIALVGDPVQASEDALEAQIDYRRIRDEREKIFDVLDVDPATRNNLPARKAARHAIKQGHEAPKPVMVPARTPWGQIQAIETVAEGIAFITTASQGGFYLTADLNERVPAALKEASYCGDGVRGFYEEERDCFKDQFANEDYAQAIEVVDNELL